MTLMWWIIIGLVFVQTSCFSLAVDDSNLSKKNNSIFFVSYGDESIEVYAKYVYSVNSAYCALFGHAWQKFDNSSTDLVSLASIGDELDPRWEKVLLLYSILQMTFENPQSKLLIENNIFVGSYLVWMDADMMIVNFNEDFIQRWISRFPKHDILISGEYHAETGVANTGCMIVRISLWSYNFFHNWWLQDHKRGHDQILFDVIYKQLMSDHSTSYVQDHIQILPINALNSLPPAYLTFRENDNVLHLMGESKDYRTKIFSFAERALMPFIQKDTKIHISRVGVTRQFLAKSMLDIIEESVPQFLNTLEMNSEHLINDHHFEVYDEDEMMKMHKINIAFTEFRERMLQHRQILLNNDVAPITTNDIKIKQNQRLFWLNKAKFYFNNLFQWYLSLPSFSASSELKLARTKILNCRISFWVEILNTLAMLGNDYLTEFCEINSVLDMSEDALNVLFVQYEETENYLRILLEWVASGVPKRSVYSMLSILYQNKASVYFTLANTSEKKKKISVIDHAKYYCDFSFQTLEHALSIYIDELLPTIEEEYDHFTEEQNSYRYRLAALYQQLGDVHCSCNQFASKPSLVGIQAYEKAADIWENLLSLKYYSPKSLDIAHYSNKIIWQEDHQHYLQVVNNALNYFRSIYFTNFPDHHFRRVDLESSTSLKESFVSFIRKRNRLSELFPKEVPRSDFVEDNTIFATPSKQKKKFRRKKI